MPDIMMELAIRRGWLGGPTSQSSLKLDIDILLIVTKGILRSSEVCICPSFSEMTVMYTAFAVYHDEFQMKQIIEGH
jgi:hypothetical protein